MKGVVFTEFLQMVESRFSEELADQIIDGCDLPSGGAYTAVGTYDHTELLQLVSELSRATGLAIPLLVNEFGRHLFGRFAELYSELFSGVGGTLDFLMGIERHIHAEVKKIYPDAELPRFECTRTDGNAMEMVYRSSRPFADLAEGLMLGCAEYFGERITIERASSIDAERDGIRFCLRTSCTGTS